MTAPLIYSVGTQVVVHKDTYHVNNRLAQPAGSVGVIVRAPVDRTHAYRVKFNDGFEAAVHHDQLVRLAEFKRDQISGDDASASMSELNERVIYRCIIGSRAYGLEDEQSDTDRRGFFLPPAELHWSLYGVPEQLENEETQEAYWELQKFIVLALKANPNVLECLYSPIVELATPLAQELLAMREVQANLPLLNESAKLSYLDELIEKKQTGAEKGVLDAADLSFYQREYQRLTREQESAFEQSTLPDQPTGRSALNDLLIRLRFRK